MSNATVDQTTEDGELSDGELPADEDIPDSTGLTPSYALFSSHNSKSKGMRQIC